MTGCPEVSVRSSIAAALTLLLAAGAALAREGHWGEGKRLACGDLMALTFEGNTTVTAATVVTSGTLVTPANQTLTNLPAFCRAQGLSQPTSDSRIYFEVWLVPGMTHCYFGPGATSFGAVGQQIPPVRDATHDIQTALENWVENGVAPKGMVATKYTDNAATTRTILLTRPLCAYPELPRYSGTSDPNDAASFVCTGARGRGHGHGDRDEDED